MREFEAGVLAAVTADGARMVELSPEQRQAFRQAFVPTWPRLAQESGPEGPRFFERMQAERRVCESRP